MFLGNTEIIEIKSDLTDEEKNRQLKKLYDVINKIAERLFYEGTDVSEFFLTDEEYNALDEKYLI